MGERSARRGLLGVCAHIERAEALALEEARLEVTLERLDA